jgi:hypothetical protein
MAMVTVVTTSTQLAASQALPRPHLCLLSLLTVLPLQALQVRRLTACGPLRLQPRPRLDIQSTRLRALRPVTLRTRLRARCLDTLRTRLQAPSLATLALHPDTAPIRHQALRPATAHTRLRALSLDIPAITPRALLLDIPHIPHRALLATPSSLPVRQLQLISTPHIPPRQFAP